jgi:hypothetical protein
MPARAGAKPKRKVKRKGRRKTKRKSAARPPAPCKPSAALAALLALRAGAEVGRSEAVKLLWARARVKGLNTGRSIRCDTAMRQVFGLDKTVPPASSAQRRIVIFSLGGALFVWVGGWVGGWYRGVWCPFATVRYRLKPNSGVGGWVSSRKSPCKPQAPELLSPKLLPCTRGKFTIQPPPTHYPIPNQSPGGRRSPCSRYQACWRRTSPRAPAGRWVLLPGQRSRRRWPGLRGAGRWCASRSRGRPVRPDPNDPHAPRC